MSPAIRLGPLVFPTELVVLLVAGAVGLLAARLFGGKRAPDISTVLWRALVIGLVAARLGFLWQTREHILQDPSQALDIRDGGWTGMVGLAAACAYVAYAALRAMAPRPALLGALALAAGTWLIGGQLLAPTPQPQPR